MSFLAGITTRRRNEGLRVLLQDDCRATHGAWQLVTVPRYARAQNDRGYRRNLARDTNLARLR